MKQNKSLSARIKRRNAQGFKGEGGNPVWNKTTPFGDYKDETQNHKDTDYALDRARKARLNFVAQEITFKEDSNGKQIPVFNGRKNRNMSKKYANHRQTARGPHKRISA